VSSSGQIRKLFGQLITDNPALSGELFGALAALVYLRWSDIWDAQQDVAPEFKDSYYEPVLPVHLRWHSYQELDSQRLRSIFTRDLPEALAGLNNNSRHVRVAHLHRIGPAVARIAKIPAPVLDHLVRWLDAEPLTTANDRRALLEILDNVLQRGRDKHSGQFYTPPDVGRLVVELAAPSADDMLYDPCFGSGGLLTAAVDYVQQHEPDRLTRACQSPLRISGADIDVDSYTVALVRLALAGVPEPHLELANSLDKAPSTNPQSEGYDLILANPPWGDKIDLSGSELFPNRTNDSTALFIEHALSQLRVGGRVVVVVPPAVLFGSGAFLRLRRMLLEEHTVEAVVGLPEGAFLPHTAIRSNILVLRRGGSTRAVAMADASSIFETKGRSEGRRIILPSVPEFVRDVWSPKGDERSWTVLFEQLKNIEWDLSPKRRDRSNIDQILRELPAEVQVLPLGQVCEISGGRSIRAEDLRSSPPRSNFVPSGALLFPEVELAEINPQGVFDFADVPIPYIRIRDVQKGVASRASSWLSPPTASSVDARWKLRSGDILLSKSGTIGKAGIVCSGAIGGIAAHGFFVLKVKDTSVDPQYLLAYLQSSECRAWMDDRASGSAIRHLTTNVVKDLPVPIPPVHVQRRVADECREHGVNALSLLSKQFTDSGTEPIALAIGEWIDANLLALDRRDDSSIEGCLNTLEGVAQSLCPVGYCEDCGKPYYLDFQTRYLHPPENYATAIATTCLACWLGVGPSPETIEGLERKTRLASWALAFRQATLPLNRLSSVPDRAGVMSVIQGVRVKAASSIESLQDRLPDEDNARRLTHDLVELIDVVAEHFLGDIKLVIRSVDARDSCNGDVLVTVSVTNESALALRDITFTTTPELRQQTGKLSYIQPGASESIQFVGRFAGVEGPETLVLRWSGIKLNGERFVGSRGLPFPVARQANHEDRSRGSLGASPYVCGDPVKTDRAEVFVGREELLDQIRRQIMHAGNVVLLEGNRRAGKSSILWHLEGRAAVPGWLGVYCSLQGTEGGHVRGVPTAEVFRAIAYELARSVRRLNGTAPLPDGTILDDSMKLGIARSIRRGISEESPFVDFRQYVEVILEVLERDGLGLLLMLDEFDKLQEGIDAGITSPQVPENIRFLVHTYPRFSAILTGSRRLRRLREEYWSALFGLGTRFGVSSLPQEPAGRLVTEPVRNRLAYAADAVDHTYNLTAGQPYLLQCLCNRIFDIAARTGIRSITVDQVNEATRALAEDNEHFASLWDHLKYDRRRFLLALIHRDAEGPVLLRLGVLHETLLAHAVNVTEDMLIEDLDFLRELELIVLLGQSSGAHYKLMIPMMGHWIERQHDFDALKRRARVENEDADD
jgi:type I restriction enzyme M protein